MGKQPESLHLNDRLLWEKIGAGNFVSDSKVAHNLVSENIRASIQLSFKNREVLDHVVSQFYLIDLPFAG